MSLCELFELLPFEFIFAGRHELCAFDVYVVVLTSPYGVCKLVDASVVDGEPDNPKRILQLAKM